MRTGHDQRLLDHAERCLDAHGDTARGAGWDDVAGQRARFDVMLDVMAGNDADPVVLCDLGCGTGALLAHLRERGLDGRVAYVGVDRSARALELARAKFPGARFVELDINAAGADLDAIDCDYLVANGLFVHRAGLTEAQMWIFLQRTLEHAWPRVRRGAAFNVRSKALADGDDDHFHASMDEMARLLHALVGWNIRFRVDYGTDEFTVYAYKPPAPGAGLR
jgi:SAM-dependent methyltransferase